MIKYSKDELPLRFQVFEHVCKYCGVTFYSNRRKGGYDTSTCRTRDWEIKKGKLEKGGTISPKPKENAPKGPEKPVFVKLKPIGKRKVLSVLCMNEYEVNFRNNFRSRFPKMNWEDVWSEKITSGANETYSFEYGEDRIEGIPYKAIIFYKFIYEEE